LSCSTSVRRSELAALEVADLTWVDDGVRMLIRRSKTDQEGEGHEIAIPRGLNVYPVASLQAWLAAAEISAGPVFRAVALGGKVAPGPLRRGGVHRPEARGGRGSIPGCLPVTVSALGSSPPRGRPMRR
jgi:hypothetical protein